MPSLRIRRLRLQGISRNYDVSFLAKDGSPARLAIIAGQISTGKTSVLEFIAYCLGAADFPHHPEIRARVRSAQLECELQDTTFVIERATVQQPSNFATVHSCGLDALDSPHPVTQLEVNPPSSPNSLSQFLLGRLGIGHVVLREAPTKDSSGVDRLSIRDVLRLMFAENPDLDNRNLLLEKSQPVVRLKHEQVLDLMFWAHDNTAASLAAQVKALEQEVAAQSRELATIEAFMDEQQVPAADELSARLEALTEQGQAVERRLRPIEAQMEAEAAFGEEQRAAYRQAFADARRLANELRETRTQLDRLMALGAQYEQDIKKLVFAKEASRLFDPLSIQVCPWCLQPVTHAQAPTEGVCLICHQALEDTDEVVDLDRELRSVRTRHKELAAYLTELHAQEEQLVRRHDEAADAQRRAQEAFDEVMRGRFSPFMAQRDLLLQEAAQVNAAQSEVGRLRAMHNSRDRRREELGSVRQRLSEAQAAQVAAAEAHVSRDAVIDRLSTRFAEILESFHFPKLANANLDGRYVPAVRGVRYDQLGSSGAMTLIALAWYLTVFEVSAEDDGAHPGLLMIDSPQKNLVPATGTPGDDYQAPAIARGVYEHLIAWATSTAAVGTQLIVVDNEPPASVDDFVVVRYTGDPDVPPYGLIDDATD
jgi:hypothetical protein